MVFHPIACLRAPRLLHVLNRLMPPSDYPTSPNPEAMAIVSLEDTVPKEDAGPPSYTSPFPVKVGPPPAAAEVSQTIVKKRSP